LIFSGGFMQLGAAVNAPDPFTPINLHHCVSPSPIIKFIVSQQRSELR
jgi:hypothetical protein